MRESLYTRVIIWVNTTLNHFDTRAILPEVESSCMVERPKWNLKQTYHQTPNTLVVSKYVKFLIYRLPNGIKRRWWYKTNTGTNKECYVVHSRVSKLHSSRYEYLNNTILTAKHLFSNFDGIKEIIVYSLSLDTRWYETFIKLFPSTLVWMWRSVTFEDNKLSLSTKTSPYCCLINVYFTLYILHENIAYERPKSGFTSV